MQIKVQSQLHIRAINSFDFIAHGTWNELTIGGDVFSGTSVNARQNRITRGFKPKLSLPIHRHLANDIFRNRTIGVLANILVVSGHTVVGIGDFHGYIRINIAH